jgi:RNA polymerase sigma-70 factor (ECF subfamily)
MERPPSHTEVVQQLFVKHVPAIQMFIRAFLPDFNRADDVLQETFLTATAKADTFREGTNFIAWATAIARLKVLESYHQRRSAEQMLSPEVIDALCAAAPIAPPSEEFRVMLRECLDALGPRVREALEMRYGDACKPAEVARRMNWTPEAVYVALSRARASLRECVERRTKRQESRGHG